MQIGTAAREMLQAWFFGNKVLLIIFTWCQCSV